MGEVLENTDSLWNGILELADGSRNHVLIVHIRLFS